MRKSSGGCGSRDTNGAGMRGGGGGGESMGGPF